MRKTIFFKTFWGNIIIAILTIFFILILSLISIDKAGKTSAQRELKNISIAIHDHVSGLLQKGEYDRLKLFIKDVSNASKIRISIIAPTGNVLVDSQANPMEMENHADRPEIASAFKGEAMVISRTSSTLMANMNYYATPLIKGNESDVEAVLRLSMFSKDISHYTKNIVKTFLLITLFVLLVMLLITFYISKKISVPIINLSEASRELSQGNYDIKLYSSDSGELGELTDNFNNMVVKQKSLIESINAEREQLEAIIGGMNDGVLVFDSKGKVKLANKSFCEMIEHKDVEDKFYWEVLRLKSFSALVEKLNESKKEIKSQITIEDSTYSICLNFLKTRSWIVVTFHDITQRSRLAKMKRDFVINASHELKTPLTSIKGFVETMEEDAGEEQKRYFEIIKRNSERVINIIQDLLMLSGVEDPNLELNYSDVDFQKIVEDNIKVFSLNAKEKGLKFNYKCDDNLTTIRGDLYRLEDMVVNLLENAVKYTDQGEIDVNLSSNKDNLNFIVEDTGVGIDKKHQSRVFERFYVVDPSRSRCRGGSGIGLSIVKHIVMAHKGEIELSSDSKGSKFIVTLPFK